jgi:hypothetical protein
MGSQCAGSIHKPIIDATTSSLTGKNKAARMPLEFSNEPNGI